MTAAAMHWRPLGAFPGDAFVEPYAWADLFGALDAVPACSCGCGAALQRTAVVDEEGRAWKWGCFKRDVPEQALDVRFGDDLLTDERRTRNGAINTLRTARYRSAKAAGRHADAAARWGIGPFELTGQPGGSALADLLCVYDQDETPDTLRFLRSAYGIDWPSATHRGRIRRLWDAGAAKRAVRRRARELWPLEHQRPDVFTDEAKRRLVNQAVDHIRAHNVQPGEIDSAYVRRKVGVVLVRYASRYADHAAYLLLCSVYGIEPGTEWSKWRWL